MNNAEMLLLMQQFNSAFYGGNYSKVNKIASEMIDLNKKEAKHEYKKKKKKRR